ncbi:3-methyl-2-oxobutanoate dehydrogenase (2-methylpropanoyl-transferring) [Altererythrobacter insulae]|nr:3-methyl-2-oxobutanoate dehydrogenase (2-methylpropanoyl-transferring) [Altererythrobacter insulae]
MAGPITQSADGFFERLSEGRLPEPLTKTLASDVGVSSHDLLELYETQVQSRRLDLESRRLAAQGKSYYSIGSSGHEGNAAVARVFRHDDVAFLHYRSGAFLLERSREVSGLTPLWDMALSFAASSEDPVSGGRHKVIGSKELFIPPQTSTIASHLPKAVGAAFGIGCAKHQRRADAPLPADSVAICSFGDASSNHSTAQGAFNAAAWTAYRGLPLPLVFLCEDNGIGISVPTPDSWVRANFEHRAGLHYIGGDARDVVDALRAAREAEQIARDRRKPVFLHLRTVRLMGHAGSDMEALYRTKQEIEREADQDPLLHTVRRLIETDACSLDDAKQMYSRISDQVAAVMTEAAGRPKLGSADEVIKPLVPPKADKSEAKALPAPTQRPQHMSRTISATLSEQMQLHSEIVVFGEDVGKKGGVYGATTGLQKEFGAGRVFDTLLDEQTVLGLAIGIAHNGFIPIPEIQFLAYVHNAEDQIRGEAATLSFFSDGQFTNPMVIRIAGLGYQKGFGGHFHNDNSITVFRDIPGVILACPSSASEAALMLRECIRLAREEQRVVVFLEPIALYGMKDLNEDGDGLMLSHPDQFESPAPFGTVALHRSGKTADCTILTYGNGTYFSRRAQKLFVEKSVRIDVVDMRWLNPLPMKDILQKIDKSKPILIVDECRETGSLSEELMTKLVEAGVITRIERITGADSFIPLGPAANEVLIKEEQIHEAIERLVARTGKGI